ncbi:MULTISPECIES: preprotein translocase subunit YajC [Corynebacterium]|uniref:Preprotein translocase subunit YajC n=2 Tax=Corynebacterium TaxID=1716 RepID=A0A558IV27_9CORY|nr:MULTISPECIES: preprotein translocase subunit YajC [Corynebacterium]KKO80038.1 preprotein translocase subunit YajC [Corynebacterium minutissimum]MTD91415.1 preprotein translocase subunit YajC [Corynebacterium aurimucosum]OFK65074.1 preprotein translocase subunit YajC [Corynebacterium sp. HMSC074A09]OFK68460.1 preprotein translocase subunit YajC [Corynebacterium sp. HMSC076G08]OFN36127.1 preprotein translocase subunit YajC [Corynebacterium sp. HMSC072A04]
MNGTQLILLLVLAVLVILPSFMSMRAQRKRQAQMKELQSSLRPGLDVITAGGLHGTVVEARGEQVDLRVKDGTVMTFDTMAIVRSAEPIASQNEAAAEPEEGEDERFPKL